MKKNILYLLAFFAVIFASCNPLKDEINNIKPVPAPKTLTLTLGTADYGLLPKENYAQKGLYFATTDDANASISVILNAKYPQLGDGNKAMVTYNSLPQVKPLDSLFANIQYTVTANDYTDAAAAVGNGTFKTYSVAQATAFLEWKYPKAATPVNKMVLLSYQFFQSNVTTSAGIPVTEAFLLLSTGWQKIYLVSLAQYLSLGRSLNNAFVSADAASLPSYFNALLKADPNVISPKVGEIKYVSYKYFQSATIFYQRITALIFDGANWGTKSVPVGPLPFLKKKGTWIADPTVYYTLIRADYTTLKSPEAAAANVGTAAGRTNAGDFGSFDVTGGANNWSDSQINDAIIFILKTKYASAPVDETVLYKITYALFRGATPTATKSFAKTSTGFVFVPEEN